MKGQVSHELEVNVPASKVWEIYGTLKLPNLVVQKLPFVEKIEVEGDGRVGTVLKLVFRPETTPFGWYKEKCTCVDNEKRILAAEVVEGGYLDMGFTLYRIIAEIMEKDSNSCVIKSTVEYEIGDENAGIASKVSTKTLELIAQAVATHLSQQPDGADQSKLDHLVFIGK